MIYINVTQTNEFVLNINNNVRNWLAGGDSVDFSFTHIMSENLTTQTVPIDPIGVYNFFGSFNGRYTEFYLSSSTAQTLFIYDGEYSVVIRNDDNEVLYRGIWNVTGNSSIEEQPFIEYQSDNENNSAFIYIEE